MTHFQDNIQLVSNIFKLFWVWLITQCGCSKTKLSVCLPVGVRQMKMVILRGTTVIMKSPWADRGRWTAASSLKLLSHHKAGDLKGQTRPSMCLELLAVDGRYKTLKAPQQTRTPKVLLTVTITHLAVRWTPVPVLKLQNLKRSSHVPRWWRIKRTVVQTVQGLVFRTRHKSWPWVCVNVRLLSGMRLSPFLLRWAWLETRVRTRLVHQTKCRWKTQAQMQMLLNWYVTGVLTGLWFILHRRCVIISPHYINTFM